MGVWIKTVSFLPPPFFRILCFVCVPILAAVQCPLYPQPRPTNQPTTQASNHSAAQSAARQTHSLATPDGRGRTNFPHWKAINLLHAPQFKCTPTPPSRRGRSGGEKPNYIGKAYKKNNYFLCFTIFSFTILRTICLFPRYSWATQKLHQA